MEALFPNGTAASPGTRRSDWFVSWPLVTAAYAYLLSLSSDHILKDGDTYWHIAAGRWILEHRMVPDTDPFSGTMRGAAWTAHEWLSEVILVSVHDLGGWTGITALTAGAFALAIVLLTRALLGTLQPTRAMLFAAVAVLMTTGHVLARPHVLAMPLMVIWCTELVRAREQGRAPPYWILPFMTVWANMHAGFFLGIGLTGAFALEAVLETRNTPRLAGTLRAWGIFGVLAFLSSLLTPHGIQAYLYTWDVMTNHSFALDHISEWTSPDFHKFQPLEIWLIAAMALVLHQGLKLPLLRLLLVLVLLDMGLKHVRNIELLGLLVPLIVASPLAKQWARMSGSTGGVSRLDRISRELARPATLPAVAASIALLAAATLTMARTQPAAPPEVAAPTLAIQAAKDAGAKGTVLNSYGWGGYLIYSGIAPFIDGRAEMYGDPFCKLYHEALNLENGTALQQLTQQYQIGWTLLHPNTPAAILLDHLPGWRRVYADKVAVVHVKVDP